MASRLNINWLAPGILRALIAADMVTVSSVNLACLMSGLNNNVQVVQNYLDDRLWSLTKPKIISDQQAVVIGYMGLQAHAEDLASIAEPLQLLLNKYQGKIQLTCWGVEPPVALQQRDNVQHVPVTIADYKEFAEYFSRQRIDIALAPLVNNYFNQCKSHIKFLEYSAIGAAGVYSGVGEYTQIVNHGVNGLLAYSGEDWVDGVGQLIDRADYRMQLAQAAQKDLSTKWLLSKNVQDRLSVFVNNKSAVGSNVISKDTVLALLDLLQGNSLVAEKKLNEAAHLVSGYAAEVDRIHHSTSWKIMTYLWELNAKLKAT